MAGLKTRCSQCLYKDNKATQEPWNKCNEIQYPCKKFENHFLPKGQKVIA